MILWSITLMISSFFKNMVDHECHVCLVLEKLRKIGFYVKLGKCEFHQLKVEFLGYIIFGNDICMDPHKVQTIMDWATPTFVQNVLCFLKFNYFYL
jgi:hypothetical protein